MDKNPLRVLDCKVPSCQEVIGDAPFNGGFLCEDCARHFSAVQSALTSQKIPFVLNSRLVRGLDYYTRTAFEIQTDALGAQNAIAGGGRYDMLVKMLGGPEQSAIGFAIGMDRLAALMMQDSPQPELAPDVFIASLGEDVREKTYEWSCALGREGIRTEIDFSDKSLKALMKRANRVGAAHVLMVGYPGDKRWCIGVTQYADQRTGHRSH